MGLKESRKKIQRSLVWLSQQPPQKMALRELRLVRTTLEGLLRALEPKDASANEEEAPPETQACAQSASKAQGWQVSSQAEEGYFEDRPYKPLPNQLTFFEDWD